MLNVKCQYTLTKIVHRETYFISVIFHQWQRDIFEYFVLMVLFLFCNMLSFLLNNLLHWLQLLIFLFMWDISYLKSFQLPSKHFWQILHLKFSLCLVFLWPTKTWRVLKIFPHSEQSIVLPQNLRCLFFLFMGLKTFLHLSHGSTVIPTFLALELYSKKTKWGIF